MNSKRRPTFFLYLVLVVVLVTCCLLPSAECRRRRKQTTDGNWDLGTGSDAQQLARGLTEIQKIKSDAINSFKYCYKDTYGRGSRMADCPTDYINDGATCRRPPSTYSQPSRMADCPSGFQNMGATCYRWWPPKSLSWDNMHCHSDEFRSGGRCYRNCKAGYTNTGEFCDRPLNVVGLDRMSCSGEFSEKTGGRCYRPCRAGFVSDGAEICWATCPSGWTNCGASCDKEGAKGCAEKIGMQVFNGVVAAGSIAAIIVSAGSAAPAIEAADMAKAASKGSKILSRLKQVKKVIDKVTAAYSTFEEAMKVAEFASQISAEQTKEAKLLLGTIDTATTLVDVLELADPTGLVSLGRSLMAPKCDQLETAWVVFTILGS